MGVLVLGILAWFAASVPDLCPRFLGMEAHPPDAFLSVAVYLAVRGRGTAAVPWAILLGLAKDCLSLDPLGTHAFVLGAVAYLFARREGHAPTTGTPRVLATAGAALVGHALYVLRMAPVAHGSLSAAAFFDAVPVALFTAALSPPLHALLDRTRALDGLVGGTRGVPA